MQKPLCWKFKKIKIYPAMNYKCKLKFIKKKYHIYYKMHKICIMIYGKVI